MHGNRLRRMATVVVLLALAAGCAGQARVRSGRGAPATTPGRRPQAAVMREVDAVYYRYRADGAPSGGTTRVRIGVRPAPAGRGRLAVYEELSGGAGEQWRASTWIAAIHASKLLGRNLADLEVTASVGGLIDGPSAGALMTATLMAAMQGAAVRPDATMTGTVNPDGTVGPVGGIVHKMEAAAQAGKKVFGYPVGLRFDRHLGTDQLVDLRSHAARLGMEAREVRDVHDAYELMTGHTLPRTEPLPRSAMRISDRLDARMRGRIGAWLTKVEQGAVAYGRLDPTMQKLLDDDAALGTRFYAESKRYLAQGMVAMAYKRARDAAVMLGDVEDSARLLRRVLRSDFQGLMEDVDQVSAVEGEAASYLASLRGHRCTTVSEALALLDAYEQGLNAQAFIMRAKMDVAIAQAVVARLRSKPLTEDEQVELGLELSTRLSSATSWYSSAALVLALAEDSLRLAASTPGRSVPIDARRLTSTATSHVRAAKATYDYYQALVLETLASQSRMSLQQLQTLRMQRDPVYRSATVQTQLALRHRAPKDVHEALLALAAARRAYVEGSLLVMRDYSLRAVQNQEGDLVGFERDAAFIEALDAANRKAREAAAEARGQLGRVPDRAAVLYERSRVLREGDTSDKLFGLQGLWMAAGVSQVATHIAAPAPAAASARPVWLPRAAGAARPLP